MTSTVDATSIAHPTATLARAFRAGVDVARGGSGHRGAAAATAVGAVLRFAWLAYARPEPVSDFKHYLHAALELVDAGVFGVGQPSAWRLPAYPVVLATGALINRDVVALSALTAAVSVAQIGLTYWVAWRVFGQRAAATAAALTAAVAPALVTFAPVLASEHLLAVLVLAALGTALGDHQSRWRPALPTGLLVGAAILTRGEALAYLPVIALVVAAGRKRVGGVRSAVTAAAITIVSALLIVLPWVIRNERIVGPGAGLTTTGGFNFYLAHSPGGYGWRTPLPLPLLITDEITRNDLGWHYGLRYVRQHPEHWLPTVHRGTRALLAPSYYAAHYSTVRVDADRGRVVAREDLALRGPAIALARVTSRWLLWAGLAGLAILSVWRRGWAGVVGLAAANWLVYAVVFWAQPRYRFVVDALACVAVGALAAVVRFWPQARDRV